MSITTKENTIGNAIINAVVKRFPSLAWDYDAQAAPLATPPATVTRRKSRKMCAIERAIRSRNIAATIAALA